MITAAVETGIVVSPVALLSPAAALLLGAALLAALPRLGVFPAIVLRAVACLAILLALVGLHRLTDAYAPLVSIPLGDLTMPVVDLGVDQQSLSWARLLLVGSLGVVIVLRASSLGPCLFVLAVASTAFLGSSPATIALAWFLTEIGIVVISRERGNGGADMAPLCLGATAMVVALYAGSLDQASGLGEASFKPLSWLLLVLAVGLRLRLWPLRWHADSMPGAMLLFLVATTTGFLVLSRGSPGSSDNLPPRWLSALLALSAVVASALSWLRRQKALELSLLAGAALAPLPLLLATLPASPSPALGPAAAHLVAALLLYALAPIVPLPGRFPAWLGRAVPLLATLTLVPLPVFPFGRAVLQVFSLLAAVRPISALVASVAMALPVAAMISAALGEPQHRQVLRWRDATSVALAASLLTTLALGLGLVSTYGAGVGSTPRQSGWAGGSSAVAVVAVVALSVADRRGLPLMLGLPHYHLVRARGGAATPLSGLGSLASGAASVFETVFRLVEGETALTWATLVGCAILIIAAGT